MFAESTRPVRQLHRYLPLAYGVSAKELERHLGVTYKTAWRMCREIRKLMDDELGQIGGKGEVVEVDETYIMAGSSVADVEKAAKPYEVFMDKYVG